MSGLTNKYVENEISLAHLGGVADGTQIGMWVAGIDPRNVPIHQIPKNKFVDPPEDNIASLEQFSKIKFN